MTLKKIFGDWAVYLILTVMVVVWLSPIIWLLFQSFSGMPFSTGRSYFLPEKFSFEPYVLLFTNKIYNNSGQLVDSTYNFIGYIGDDGMLHLGSFINTIWVALVSMVFSTLMVLMTAYAFSRLRFKARGAMMRVILIMGMFPGFLGMIVLYWVLRQIGMTQNLFALCIVYSAGAGASYYVAKGFFDTISKQIDEAAMIDGATRFQIFYKITIPLSKPIIVNQALVAFMGPWGEYITSAYLLGPQVTTKDNWTVAKTLFDMLNGGDLAQRTWYWRTFAAGGVLIAVPICVLFIFMQRYYVSGVTGGAVKG